MQLVRPAIHDENGKLISEAVIRQDYSAKVRALELLGKHHRMFSDRLEVVVSEEFL